EQVVTRALLLTGPAAGDASFFEQAPGPRGTLVTVEQFVTRALLLTSPSDRQATEGTRCRHSDVRRGVSTSARSYDNAPDGVVEKGGLGVLIKAKKAGKIRFLAFTGHKDPRIHLAMVGKHTWDTVQMPINICDWHYRSFVKQVVPEANKR